MCEYKNADGEPTTLKNLCAQEPEWAASVITELKASREELRLYWYNEGKRVGKRAK